MQIAIPPIAFLFSAMQYILYNSTSGDPGNYEYPTDSDSEEVNYDRKPFQEVFPRNQIIADTRQGRVRGLRLTSRNGERFSMFRGIPYGRAPVGELRFEPPVPHPVWQGTRNCYYFKPQCTQVNIFTKKVVGSEDCLFLNIATKRAYTFRTLPKDNSRLHPVIVYIHGGLFMFGSGNPYRPKYFLDEDVVLVTLNYRLNSFGFLNTGDGVVAGNMGLKDQVLALKWIQENIKYFNGDPTRVTLMGVSAGGVSTHLHTLSPMSHGLFSGAVSLSGTALSPWGHVDDPVLQAKEFGVTLGCPILDSRRMVACLKKLPAQQIGNYHVSYVSSSAQGKQALFGPTVDSGTKSSKFLPDDPLKLLRSGRISRRPWINGVNSGDGLVFLIPFLRNESLRNYINSQWEEKAPLILDYEEYQEDKRVDLTTEVNSFYLHEQGGISHRFLNDTGAMFSDRAFFLDSHDVGVMQSRVAPTYLHYYEYKGVYALGNLLLSKLPLAVGKSDKEYLAGGAVAWAKSWISNRKRKGDMEAFHGDELPLLFNIPLQRRFVGRRDVDYEFSRKLVKLYVGFARKGVPDPGDAGERVRWAPVPNKGKWHPNQFGKLWRLRLGEGRWNMVEEPFFKRMRFWKRHDVSYLPES